MSKWNKNPNFKGVIGYTVADSELHSPNEKEVPEGAPNVLFVVLDDMGFSHLGSYGSDIDTANIDRLANGGLRYNNFHTTAICSPTRASLLTGQNPHTAGVSNVTDFANGFPNKRGYVGKETALLSEVLIKEGYSTFAVGKWHLSPTTDNTFAGPFDQWPLSRGFEHFYGFMNGETNQYTPDLILGNDRIVQPKTPEEGYHLTEDLVDKAIEYIGNQISTTHHKPFFGYLALGATHAPHHAPASYIDKYKGRYDKGWDEIRKEWFNRQKELGIIPENTQLAPLNPGVTAWEDLSNDQKRLYARMQEVFAAFLDHTDDQIGRVIDYLEETGQLDNTVIVLLSDNGASREGGYHGTWNEWKNFNLPNAGMFEEGLEASAFEEELSHIDQLGSPLTYNHYPTGWAQTGNTPLKWYKTYVHAGGVKDPLIIHYPNGIKTGGGIREQFHFVSDIAPTILEIIGVQQPEEIKGTPQIPFAGISLAYSFDQPNEKSKRTVQHFELWGHRAIWKEGWKAVAIHLSGEPYESDQWELYHVDEDFSENHDLAQTNPEKLEELKQNWEELAIKYDVFPLDDMSVIQQKSEEPQKEYTFYPTRNFRINTFDSKISLKNKPLIVTADVNISWEADEGVLFAQGGRFGGFALYVKDKHLVFHYSYFGEKHYSIRSTSTIPVGPAQLKFEFVPKGNLQGTGVLYINGEKVGEGDIDRIVPALDAPGYFTIGEDIHTAVSPEYEAPFPFTGKLNHVRFEQPQGGQDQESRLIAELATE
ncbi:arylsulfatase [Paenibacillus sp. DS2015]|uniref:sulfatase-like hydrolase/transferase n=1 Tax=Paenibacillus sp. DS2015 TaxID=3373917 RepID=UPI003D1A93D3